MFVRTKLVFGGSGFDKPHLLDVELVGIVRVGWQLSWEYNR